MNFIKKNFDFDIKTLSHLRTVGSINKISFPTNVEEVQKSFHFARENGYEPFILGGGSNTLIGHLKKTLLISDRNIPTQCEIKDNQVLVSSNININNLINQMAQNRLYGLEFLAGLPAHLGGLLSMNAGAYDKNISDYIEWITVIDEDNEAIFYKKDLLFGYRTSNIIRSRNLRFPHTGFIGKICLKLDFETSDNFYTLIKEKIDFFIHDREAKHPINDHSLGCFFKNTEKYPAGYLIEHSGLKSYTIGGAMVSPKHANFLINKGNASFEDFINLIDHVKKVVWEKFDVKLELEVKIVNY